MEGSAGRTAAEPGMGAAGRGHISGIIIAIDDWKAVS
jgi:hypothetical protein